MSLGTPGSQVRLQTAHTPGATIMGTVLNIARQDGLLAFYRGVGPPLLGVGALNAILFSAYGATSRLLSAGAHRDSHSYGVIMASGSSNWVHISASPGTVAGGFCSLISTPTELLKCRVQLAQREGHGQTSTWRELVKIFRTKGPQGVFKGTGITMLRDAPSFGAYFIIYEYFRRLTYRLEAGPVEAFAVAIFNGGMAGALSWLTVYPLDVIKTHLQTQDLDRPRYTGVVDCARQLYRTHGLRVFGNGLASCLLRAFPLNGVTFAVYELSSNLLKDYCNI
ncbi:uncharacterized protein MONBRDRAFT_23012 [Monosiga brevicollis MX1]|uniref:Mitochondrial carrier protein n=1 Tax=Monosiga brevicollis TaxID=81824 RepID=A9USR4_MONBE|nr:uncharacterized protein MONBRDRAFT_23012 [Monosiga brevicollis MX1]EDQ92149.1 predicted protein [Monosiga brevicollis MX1]|eukprot:XP_001743435.1 hypothetical protein [Monosiga brevicollis MX1]